MTGSREGIHRDNPQARAHGVDAVGRSRRKRAGRDAHRRPDCGGRKFAHRVCGACHVVAQQRDELPVLAPPGPSFAVLAQRPLLTEQSLREFLGSNHRSMGPHEAMPNPRLADYQIDEIVAFFMTLKAAR